ncbi:MAG: putative cytosolic protein [Deltaproteobacteria bacterium]|nr:putative cytosolic protein [Deltaproteobacteria bacterium]
MALDGPLASDEIFTEQGVEFVIDKKLFEDAKPISIDFIESAMGAGFLLKSGLSASGDDGCCSSSAGGCGSGCSS